MIRTSNIFSLKPFSIVSMSRLPASKKFFGEYRVQLMGFIKAEYMMTSTSGIFAAGDVRLGVTKQAATAQTRKRL